MKNLLFLAINFKNPFITRIWILFGVCFILLSACKEEDEPFPEGFNRVAGFQLIPFDSVFLVWPGERELFLAPRFTGAYGDEIILPSIPTMQIFIDGKPAKNPPRIPVDKEREFEVFAKIGKLTSRPIKIKVVDVDPKTYISGIKVSMGDSTKAPYAVAGRSLVDFKLSVFDYRGKEFSEADKPAFKFFLDGVPIQNLHRFPVLKSGEISFWAEVGDKKSNVEILYSRDLPDLSKKFSLPLVFHVVHSGQEIGNPENTGQEKIVQLLNWTNDWMMGRLPFILRKGHNQVVPNLEYYLATVGPDGNPLDKPGINRIFSEKSSFGHVEPNTGKFLFDQMWNPNEYVNVFVMNIDDVSGFGMFPPISNNPPTSFYGFVINKRLTPFVMIHEMGHFLGLPHTFTSGENCNDGDKFPDTETYNKDKKKSDKYLKTNCEEEFFYATNMMDYGPTAANTLTLDQVTRMRSTLERGYFLPVNSNPNERINPKPWIKGIFDPRIKPID